MWNRLCSSRRHLPGALALIAVVVILFRLPLFGGYRFLGNSDRWNHHLSFVAFHSGNLALGTFSAWSEHLLMGFDTLALPGNFPSPLFALPALLGSSDVVKVSAYTTLAILALTMLGAYIVLHSLCEDRLAAVAGALIFSLSTFSLLKLSQNDNEYLPVLLTPALFHLVRTATPENFWRRAGILTAIVWASVYVLFLQPFAYVVIFIASYAAYRWFVGHRTPLVAVLAALGTGSILAAPRVLLQFQDVMRSSRTSGGVMEYVSPTLFLRYLDGFIFGRSAREATGAHLINLSEGNLLFSSIFASLLLLLVIARGRYRARVGQTEPREERYGFHIAFVLFVFLVVHFLPVYKLFSFLFAKVSFLHTRFTVAAMFPAAIVSSLYLSRPPGWRLSPRRAATVGVVAGAVLLLGHADFHSLRDPALAWLGRPPAPFVRVPGSRVAAVVADETLRWGALAAAFLAILLARRPLKLLDAGTFRTILAVVIGLQSVLAADEFLNGPHTRIYAMPFETHDLLMAAADEFLPPTPTQLGRMHTALDDDRYRSVVVCPREVIAVDCSTSIGMRWRIRLADGYLNGVSKRYMSLPWPPAAREERGLRFHRQDPDGDAPGLPWKLLSLLNVRNAIAITPALIMNKHLRVPEDVVITRNPSPYVYPRAYFASQVASVTREAAAEAIQKVFAPCAPVATDCSPLLEKKHPVDYVEGPVRGRFDSDGTIQWLFEGDAAIVDFPPSPGERFLVINEAYHPRWVAEAAGRPLAIYPTNVAMRGLLVRPGVTRVTFRYRSVLRDTLEYLVVVLPVGGLAGLASRRWLRAVGDRLVRTARTQ